MSASFYDLLKYAKTGIASSDMTAYDKMRALAMAGGGAIKTLTGVPPLSFKANGKPLISWSMLGNGQQTGTPSPDNIIMPDFCGVRTGNLFDMSFYEGKTGITVSSNKATGTCDRFYNIRLSIPSELYGQELSWSAYIKRPDKPNTVRLQTIDNGSNKYGNDITGEGRSTVKFTATSTIRLYVNYGGTGTDRIELSDITLNSGSTVLPYEPYGYKLPITNAGQTVPVYLGQTQTVRKIRKLVLDGTETSLALASTNLFTLSQQAMPITDDKSAVCTHFAGVASRSSYSQLYADQICVRSTGTQIWIRCSNIATLDDFKAFLAAQYANGTPVTVWYVLATPTTAIVNEPLAKIGTYADELHSEDAGVTIPTSNGQNTLTVDTDLQPFEMTITYKE